MVQKIKITLPGGKEVLRPAGLTVGEALADGHGGNVVSTMAAKVNGLPVWLPSVICLKKVFSS